MKMNTIPLAFVALTFIGAAPFGQRLLAQGGVYDLPNDDAGCPANCRQIPWRAGSDLWNGGTLPNYTQTSCSPLYGDGIRDDSSRIQSCINTAGVNTAVFLPAGTYLVNGTVRLKSSVVLRGAGPSSTFINLSSSGWLTTQNFSTAVHLNPTITYNTNSPGYALSGAPKKGDKSLTISTGTVNVDDWIAVFSDDDPSLVTANGDNGHCGWCADNTGYHLIQQIVQVTSVNGPNITVSRPLYYTLYTHPQYRKYSFPTKYAGFEGFKVSATGDIGARPIITLQGTLFGWVKNIETYNTGSSSGSAHIELDFSYGCEIRDSYLHFGRSGASGSGYGVYFQFVNSDHKVENNIMRDNRHSIVYQGGGSGTAVLYNYMDNDWTDDPGFLGSARTSHGAHPYMNLFEGNIVSHLQADSYWGSSSHFVMFRNWLWGDESGGGNVPSWNQSCDGTGLPCPYYGFIPVNVDKYNTYYSFVGNVLGRVGGNVTWSGAATRPTACPSRTFGGKRATPTIYAYGCNSNSTTYDDAPSSTSINHGNYDYKTQGVAYWDGGAQHALRTSMYYSEKPAFFGSCSWPAFGPDLSSITNALPAKARFDGASSCVPLPPTNLTTSVR
jgi:hypothetical protein